MRDLAIVFPGQGCQFVGMGQDLYAQYPEARELFDKANDLLGFDLSELCFQGPKEALNDTANTQPAIYVTSMALWTAFSSRCGVLAKQAVFMAGHSLGEYAALTSAGALSFEDGVRLVRARGIAMRDAGTKSPGGMAAIIGLDDAALMRIVEEAGGSEAGIWVANWNSPGQVVIAGKKEALNHAMELATARKARRVVPLAVSVACHTPLMEGAVEGLREALERVALRPPRIPVVQNVSARPTQEPEMIRQALLQQLSAPVRWVETVRYMVDQGVARVLEIGPKAVVSGLVRRIHRPLRLQSITNAQELATMVEGEQA